MKRLITLVGIAATAVLAAAAAPAFTADQGTVNLTVQVASPCITVSPDSTSFGAKSFSVSAESPSSTDAADRPQVTNCSASAESLFVSGTDAVGSLGAKWALGTPETIGANRYGLKVAGQAATKSNQALGGPLAAGDLRRDTLVLFMPIAGSDGSGQTMSMSLTYTATF
jgi:type 1 fimbria pilin